MPRCLKIGMAVKCWNWVLAVAWSAVHLVKMRYYPFTLLQLGLISISDMCSHSGPASNGSQRDCNRLGRDPATFAIQPLTERLRRHVQMCNIEGKQRWESVADTDPFGLTIVSPAAVSNPSRSAARKERERCLSVTPLNDIL